MCSPSTICVDDDLTTSQPSITLGSTNDETARGLNLETYKLTLFNESLDIRTW